MDYQLECALRNAYAHSAKLSISKVRLNGGGYAPDHCDEYFGVHPTLAVYVIRDVRDSHTLGFIRAASRSDALAIVARVQSGGRIVE